MSSEDMIVENKEDDKFTDNAVEEIGDDRFTINEVRLSKAAVKKMTKQQLKELVDRIMAEQAP